MARGSWNDRPKMVPEAHKALDNMKYEIASDLVFQLSKVLKIIGDIYLAEIAVK